MTPPFAQRRLILFGRYPRPGETKTRLIPLLGPLGAAELQRELTERTLATMTRAGLAPVAFAYTGGTPAQMGRWLAGRRVGLYPQEEGNLGQRMQSALENALATGARQAVLVGTDVPGLSASHLAQAFAALDSHDLVFGPSRDGGYWLVGTRRPAGVFDGIAWGTGRVLDQSLDLARRQGLSAALLPPLDDMDTPEDLRAWRPAYDWRRPYLSVVIPALNEAPRIAAAVEQTLRPGVETLVVDGGSRDQTPLLARRAGAEVLVTSPGRAVQQNIGAAKARGRALLFLHADTRLSADFDLQLFEVLMDPRVAMGAFQFKTDLQGRTMRWIEAAARLRVRWLRLPYGDQALFMRRAGFWRAGGFPEVPIAEDLFLARNMAGLGRIVLAPGAAITSGRRWRRLGIVRTTLINYLIAAGCLAGVDPNRLAPLYRLGPPCPRRCSKGMTAIWNRTFH